MECVKRQKNNKALEQTNSKANSSNPETKNYYNKYTAGLRKCGKRKTWNTEWRKGLIIPVLNKGEK